MHKELISLISNVTTALCVQFDLRRNAYRAGSGSRRQDSPELVTREDVPATAHRHTDKVDSIIIIDRKSKPSRVASAKVKRRSSFITKKTSYGRSTMTMAGFSMNVLEK